MNDNNSMVQSLAEVGIKLLGELKGPYKIVVPLSGGKDSQACLMLALQEHPAESVLALFCDTQYEHPMTYEHIERTVSRVNVDLVTLNAGSVLSMCLKHKRFPGGGARHCTDELKIRPSKFFYRELAKQQGGFEVWYGVRTGESHERAKRYAHKSSDWLEPLHSFMPSKYPKYLAQMGVMCRLPIVDWSTEDVLDFLNGEENPLYRVGFDRVGCFPCLAGGEEAQMRAFYFDKVGKKHYAIAEQIADVAGRDVLVSKRYAGQGPGCLLCSI